MRSDKDVKITEVSCADTLVQYFQNLENIKNPPLAYYPARQNRYSLFGWNRHYQDCYSDKEIALNKLIVTEFKSLATDDNYFQLTEESRLYGWWTCTKPGFQELTKKIEAASFTLSPRQEKDSKLYPLWSYADNMARHIANWQSQRIQNQQAKLMSDPPMLAFEELRDWFSFKLAEAECKPETIDIISKRQSYLKNLIYLFPNFGPDRLHLSDIQESLSDATKIVSNCVTSKNLPQLLSDVVTSGKSLENTLGTYLHFLLIDEPVSDNFSPDYMEGTKRDCESSPVCKIFKKTANVYDLVKLQDMPTAITYDLRINKSLFSFIKFASFASQHDKDSYMEAMASLHTLSQVRKTLENFQGLQSKIGSYVFAINYLEKATKLADNYINLIENIKTSIKSMIKSSEKGLHHLLTSKTSSDKKAGHFEKNFQSLETRVVKGTTLVNQLDTYTKSAVESVQKYQLTLKKLATDVQTGQASIEIEQAMNGLFKEIHYLNSIIPGLLNKQPVVVTTPPISGLISSSDALNSLETLQQCPTQLSVENVPVIHLFDYGRWDDKIDFDARTNDPIFTYRIFKNDEEVGAAQFYGQPILCASANKQRHNIIATTGIFKQFDIPADASIEAVCRALPPTLFDRVIVSAQTAAVSGAIRGSSTVIGLTLKSLGTSDKVAFYLRHLSYFLGYFSFRFYSHYQPSQHNVEDNFWLAMYQAAIETGEVFFISAATNVASYCLKQIGESFDYYNWKNIGKSFKHCSNLVKYSMFAYNTVSKGLPEAAASLAAGTAAELAIEGAGRWALPS